MHGSSNPTVLAASSIVKQWIRSLLPFWLLKFRQDYLIRNPQKQYTNLTTKEVFTKIYQERAWGGPLNSELEYFSGSGTHNDEIAGRYVSAAEGFLSSFADKPDVVDLGCGDFTVGSQLRPLCNRYIACDIVGPLIEWNRERYRELDVDFRVLDLSEDELPPADIVFLRQVLQHLSNDHIARALPQLSTKYRYLVLTEHLPSLGKFRHNIDKPAGASVRSALNSGVILTSPPFNLSIKETAVLCELAEGGGIIRTNVYRLR